MSRGYLESRAAWEAWLWIYTRGDAANSSKPVGFGHHCGAVTKFDDVDGFDSAPVCSGCRSDVTRPERECTPLYATSPAPAKPEKIRVLRILEYTYDDARIAAQDMSRWTHSIPLSTGGMKMRSMTLPFDTIEWEDA